MSAPGYYTVLSEFTGWTIEGVEEHKTYAIFTLTRTIEVGGNTGQPIQVKETKEAKIYAGGHGYPNRIYSEWKGGL